MDTEVNADRIKDIASFEGVRENQLIGYGLVVGLEGTGDKGISTMQSIANMLQRMGLAVRPNDIKAKNTAAVIVTATLPPFPKPGLRIDALVSTIGDAKSLQGGTLLLTPLKGIDGNVYALAQGPVSIGGFIGGGGTKVQKNHPAAGRVPEGAIVEKDPPFVLGGNGYLRLFLHKPDFTTANAITKKINEVLQFEYANTIDPSSVRIKIPQQYLNSISDFVSQIEGIDVSVDIPAKVVVNEKTGTVVIGENVKIAPVAIAHGNLTIEVKTEYQVSQPPPLAPPNAETVVLPKQEVKVKEEKASLVPVSGANLGEVVKALNALGVTPRDLISILQVLRKSGALKAEVEIM
ncbi:MAG: flagellar basal body P-ring protein FlgI [Thermodesulfovibrionales bacterium]|nr:flagellar basal body P-ring protein FlgI [Thermodesulfovibrionales bacterium]